MEYIVTYTKHFEDDLRFYTKKKKCKKLIQDIRNLEKDLQRGIFQGKEIKGVGLPIDESSYKIRMADTTHKIGTRGGFRVIYYVIKNNKEVFLLTIYSKKDKADILPKEVQELIKQWCD